MHKNFTRISLIIFSLFFACNNILYATTLSSSSTVTLTATVSGQNVPTPPVSNYSIAGGGVILSPQSGSDMAIFRGIVYPGSIITLLKNGFIETETPANLDGTFEIHIKNTKPGTYNFSLRAEDSNHIRSVFDSYTVYLFKDITTIISKIFIPPTISSDKEEVKQGNQIIFFGQSAPKADIIISIIYNNKETIKRTTSTSDGHWIFILDTADFNYGKYYIKARSEIKNDLSLYSNEILFTVGDKDVFRNGYSASFLKKMIGDFNNDYKVNIIDFSIMVFWYKRNIFPPEIDLNNDGKVDLTDLSILAYYWTG